jgi:HPt (histidine-containing phosphotransfer) domain-containing protein
MTDTARPGAQSPDDSPVSGLVDRAHTLASNAASSAQDKVRSLAEEQKNAAAEQVEDVARMIDSAAEQVERVLPEAGHYVRDAAGGVRRVSSAVREKSVDDIVEMGLDFARSRPGTFLAGSVLVGFALARFLKSSADRRAERSPGGHAAKGRQAGGAKKSSSGRAGGRAAGAAAGGSTGNADASATAGV